MYEIIDKYLLNLATQSKLYLTFFLFFLLLDKKYDYIKLHYIDKINVTMEKRSQNQPI